jgi:hypothetical protein
MRPDWLNQRLTKKNQVRSQFRPQLEWLEDRLAPATFTVRNTFDVGPDSLRQAILDANANQALDNIVFAIPGDGVHTIFLADQMIITDPVIIDGYTQQGASPNTLAVGDNAVLKIEIDGSSAPPITAAFIFNGGGGSTVRGLVINHMNAAAFNTGPGFGFPSNNNTIAGNFIGTDATGTAYAAGGDSGIYLQGIGNTIGGPDRADRNVIVAGSSGIERMITFDGDTHDNTIQGNYFGVNAAGTAALNGGNTTQGMFPGSSSKGGNTIEDNVIVANDFAIKLESDNNVVRNNLIGTNTTGTAGLGGGQGIVVQSGNATSNHNTITSNLISGGSIGIVISTSPSFPVQGLVIQGNKIGTDITGTAAIPNSSDGINIDGPGGASIGGTNPGDGNIIAFNGGVGVILSTAGTNGYDISGNSIFANGGLGIDLSDANIQDGATHVNPNDAGDPDSGPNQDQNFPVLTSATAGSSTTITGTLNSTPNTTFRIEFFASNAADPTGFGEGQIFLGATPATGPGAVTTDANGDASFSVRLPVTVGATQVVTATATDPAGNTSEFSQSVTTRQLTTAVAGGPYSINEGDSLTLDASGSSDPDGDPLTYSWDVNDDGVYGDATGVGPTLTWAQLEALSPAINDGAASFNARVRVDDGHGDVVDSSVTTLTVNNTAPTAAISAPMDGFSGIRGQLRTFTLTASDPSFADQAANFTFTIVWGDGSPNDTVTGPSGSATSHTYSTEGTYSIQVTAQDKDGGISATATRSQTILIVEQQGATLAVGGTAGADRFSYSPGATSGSFRITVNSVFIGTFTPAGGQVLSYGYALTDSMTVNGSSADDGFAVTATGVTLNGTAFDRDSVENLGINGQGGMNSLTGANTTNAWTLTSASAGKVNSVIYSNMESAIGGTGTDTLLGPNLANTWTITSTNAGTFSTLSFSGMENLTGGPSTDTFNLSSGAGLTGTVSGGAGADTINGAATTNTWTLTAANAGNVNGTLFNGIESVNGGAGTDTLIGRNVVNAWNITTTNGGTLSTLTFAGMENLTGGANGDTFRFSDATSVTGVIDGGSGKNTLDYSLYSTGVTVDLLTGMATGTAGVSNIQNLTGSPANDSLTGNAFGNAIQGNGGSDTMAGDAGDDTFIIVSTQASTSTIDGGAGTVNAIIGANVVNTWTLTSLSAGSLNGMSFSNIEKLTGGTSTDTLTGPDTVNSWIVGNTNTGSLNATLTFSAMENLVGGVAVDNFRLADGKGVTGSINGGGGGDWVDYSLYTTAVTVNLATGSATNVTGGVSNIQHVRGGNGGNTLTGNSLGNILIGGTGADTITGGSGRSILIGRGGADSITGGGDDDIVIGGTTSFDSFRTAHNASLAAMLAEWQSGNSYGLRIAHLRGTTPGGLNGASFLKSTTVFDDVVADTLTGGAGRDWFWAQFAEITDPNNGGSEQVN